MNTDVSEERSVYLRLDCSRAGDGIKGYFWLKSHDGRLSFIIIVVVAHRRDQLGDVVACVVVASRTNPDEYVS